MVIAAVVVGGVVLLLIAAHAAGGRRLRSLVDGRVIFLEQLPSNALLAGYGTFEVVVYRQSGDVHSSEAVTGSASAALGRVLTIFRRARIDAIGITDNTAETLAFRRLHHNHRGSNEGKKVGGASITRVASCRYAPPSRQLGPPGRGDDD